MVIGIVVNVMEEEHSKAKSETEPSNKELKQEIQALKELVMSLKNKR